MPPPATFYTISSFPYSQVVTQADFNGGSHSGGVANEVWFKYVLASALGIGFYADIGGTFNYRVEFFESDSLTARTVGVKSATWCQAQTVTNYWIRVRREPAGASDFDFTAHLDSITLSPSITPGDYLVNDDSSSTIGGLVFAPDGTLRGFAPSVPAGEIVAGLPSGHVLFHDRFNQYGPTLPLTLLDTDLSHITSFNLSPGLFGFPAMADNRSDFFVWNQSNGNVYKITTTGSVSLLVSALSATASNAIGVNPAATILYYVLNNSADLTIKRYDLGASSSLSDLYTIASATDRKLARTGLNDHPGEIVVLSDGSLVTYYQDPTATSTSVLLHISSSGTLLHSYTYSTGSRIIDHISRAPDDPVSINVWFFAGSDNNGTFEHINLSTGVADDSVDMELFEVGANTNENTTTMFGPSSSCGFTTLLMSDVAITPNIPQANSSECCASEGTAVEGGGSPAPGAGVSHPVLLSAAWTGRCTGGGTVPLLADLTDDEDWSDS